MFDRDDQAASRRFRHAADRDAALGHLVGALGNWVPLQDTVRLFLFRGRLARADERVRRYEPLTSNAYENVADWIGAGLDPEKSTFFIQSLVPEHAELYLLLSMVVPVPWLERVPTYKEQQENLKDKDLSSIGFLGYPLLQTADVAMYDAQLRAGRRGSGRAPRAGEGSRAAVQQHLRDGTTCWSSRSRC